MRRSKLPFSELQLCNSTFWRPRSKLWKWSAETVRHANYEGLSWIVVWYGGTLVCEWSLCSRPVLVAVQFTAWSNWMLWNVTYISGLQVRPHPHWKPFNGLSFYMQARYDTYIETTTIRATVSTTGFFVSQSIKLILKLQRNTQYMKRTKLTN